MNVNLIQSGLNLANYLQSAFPPEDVKNTGENNELYKGTAQPNHPPALIRSLIDSGRFYFRLSHEDALNNLMCLFVPVGTVRKLVPDLYIPTVSICTFLLLRSIYIVFNTTPHPYLGDVFGRTVTRVCLVYITELIIHSALAYVMDPAPFQFDNLRQDSISTDRSSHSRMASPSFRNDAVRSMHAGINQQYGATKNPFGQSTVQVLVNNQVASPFNNVSPLGNVHATQSQYGQYGNNNEGPTGMMDGHYGNQTPAYTTTGNTKMQDTGGNNRYFGDNMGVSLTGTQGIHLPIKLFIMGYKYVLLDFYMLIAFLMPVKALIWLAAIYIAAASILFSVRSIAAMEDQRAHNNNPLMYVFPALQPVFCYILLPRLMK